MRDDSLAATNHHGSVRTKDIPAQIFRPLTLRAKVYSDRVHAGTGRLLIYDGRPDKGGQLIASKVVDAGDRHGAIIWFEWTPRKLGQHHLHAVLLERAGDPNPGNNIKKMAINVVPADTTPPALSVTLTPNRLWPADGQFVPVKAVIRVTDNHDPKPQVKLHAILSNEDNDASPDIKEARFDTDDRTFSLRAERGGQHSRPRRVYTVVYSATDWAGNKTFARAEVIVPTRVRR